MRHGRGRGVIGKVSGESEVVKLEVGKRRRMKPKTHQTAASCTATPPLCYTRVLTDSPGTEESRRSQAEAVTDRWTRVSCKRYQEGEACRRKHDGAGLRLLTFRRNGTLGPRYSPRLPAESSLDTGVACGKHFGVVSFILSTLPLEKLPTRRR